MRDFLARTEPLRRWLYGLVTPTLAVLAIQGTIREADVVYYGALAAAALAVGTGVEMARNNVRPITPLPDARHANRR